MFQELSESTVLSVERTRQGITCTAAEDLASFLLCLDHDDLAEVFERVLDEGTGDYIEDLRDVVYPPGAK